MFTKILLEDMGKFNILAVRFILAFIILMIIFNKKIKNASSSSIIKGFILGLLFFIVMFAELSSLETTPTSTVSFLENTAIVIVPFIECIVKKKLPSLNIVLGSLLAFIGVGFLTLKNGLSMSYGELICLFAALFYAISIITTDRLSKKDDTIVMGIFQIGFLGLFSLIASFIFENPILPNSQLAWIHIGILIIVCTGFGFTLQPVAQKYTSSETAGILCALSPAMASILGIVFLGEKITTSGIVGSILILLSMFIPVLNYKTKSKSQMIRYVVNKKINR